MLRLQAFKFELQPSGEQLSQPAAVRWFVPLRLQQGFGSQHRTLREKGKATGLRGPVRSPAKLEEGARIPVRRTSASVAASVAEPGTSVHKVRG